jgi:hypothetical protein
MDIIETTVILREIHVPEGKALKNIVTETYHTGEIDPALGYWTFYLGKEEKAENYIYVDEKDVPIPPEPDEHGNEAGNIESSETNENSELT